jgi:hypoxanthine phosphoribosyltransferase
MRCGQVPAIHLSYILGVRDVGSIAVKTTPSDEPLATERIKPEIVLNTPLKYITNKKVLLVDAVMESGNTAVLCIEEISKHKPAIIKIAMIVDWDKNTMYKIESGKRPDIDYFGTKADMWPDFPWEH